MGKRRGEWEAIIREYVAQQERYAAVQAKYCASAGVSLAAFQKHLYALTVDDNGVRRWAPEHATQRAAEIVRARRGVAVPASTERHVIRLSERDIALLLGVAHDRAAPVDVIAMRLFGGDVVAAEKRLRELQSAQLVSVRANHGGVVTLTARGARSCGVTTPRRFHPRHLAHHLCTLRAIEGIRQSVAAEGGRLVDIDGPRGEMIPYRLEVHVQGMERAEKSAQGTERGERYDAAPDAVVRIAWPDGRVETVAVEYFTAAYSGEQIADKAQLAQNYDRVIGVADSASTAERVQDAIGIACTAL